MHKMVIYDMPVTPIRLKAFSTHCKKPHVLLWFQLIQVVEKKKRAYAAPISNKLIACNTIWYHGVNESHNIV